MLRRELGTEAIRSEGEALRLDAEQVGSDVAAFDHALRRDDLERAVGLYAGPFLDGFYLRDAPEFERWSESERGRLVERYEQASPELRPPPFLSGGT